MTDQEYEQWLLQQSSIKTVLIDAWANVGGVETPFHLSNRTYTSETHINYDVCVKGGVSFEDQLSLTGEPSIGSGDIELSNENGLRDEWLTYVWKNRRITVRIGDPRWDYADFRLVFDGVISHFTSTNSNNLIIQLLNKLDRLNEPALSVKLGGSGTNADKLIPAVLGEVHNITPLLINNDQTYQVHSGPIEDIIEVRDNGDPRSDIVESLSTGQFTVDEFAVVGQITASVQGTKDGVYYNDIANLVKILAKNYGPSYQRFVDSDLDLDNLDAFSLAHPDPVGIYIDSEQGVLAAAQELAKSVGAQIICTSLGKLRLVQLAIPTSSGKELTPNDFDYRTLRISETTQVKAAVKLAYCKNYTVQTSGLAAGLPVSSLDLFKEEWLTVTEQDSAVASLYRLTEEPEQENTLLLRTVDATAEAVRRLEMWKVPRQVFEMECRAHMLLTELGDTLTIKHPRYGLQDGKNGIVIGVSRDWLRGRAVIKVLI